MIKSILTSSAVLMLMLSAVVAAGTLAANPTIVHAQNSAKQLCIGSGGEWTGKTCEPKAGESTVTEVVQRVINILLFAVGIASVIMLVVGGIRFAVSAGDANAVQAARNTIIYALVGLVVAFLAFALTNFVINRLIGS